jgi:hypothetical protein
MTMISLEVIGKRQGMETFPPELDVDRLAGLEMNQLISLALCEDLLDNVRDHGRTDIEPAVAALAERGRRSLGLAKSHRSRPSRHGKSPAPSGVEVEALEAELAEVLGSRSWRLTAPLRRLRRGA